jgi:hypothetical protein
MEHVPQKSQRYLKIFAKKPIDYCFGKDENRLNPFGCKFVDMEWAGFSPWFSYGRFRKDGITGKVLVWEFDKERIKHEAHQNIIGCRFCPHIRLNLIDAIIEVLPSEINPCINQDWEFEQIYEHIPGAEKITTIEDPGEFEYKSEELVFGVRPKGIGALRKVLSDAFALADIVDVKASDILK